MSGSVRLPALLAGVLAVVIGAAVAATGELLSPPWVQDAVLIAAALVVAGIAVVGLLVAGLESDDGGPADRSGDRSVRTPGDDLDERLASTGGFDGARADLRQRVLDAGTAALARRSNVSRERARELLETGAWTDDPDAAAFFTGEGTAASLGDRLRALLGGETAFRRRAERATAALLEDER